MREDTICKEIAERWRAATDRHGEALRRAWKATRRQGRHVDAAYREKDRRRFDLWRRRLGMRSDSATRCVMSRGGYTASAEYMRREKRGELDTAPVAEPAGADACLWWDEAGAPGGSSLQQAGRQPKGCSDVRWRIELKRRKNARYYACMGDPV